MADKTDIEWTDATWNPLRGCSRVSEGCRNCYAESVANRFKGPGMPYEGLIAKGGQWNGQINLVPETLQQPLRWRRPRRIFVNSMSDLFHENVPFEYIDKVFAVMAMAHWHTFQVLTKRPERMLAYFKSFWGQGAEARGFNVCSHFNASTEDVQRIAATPKGLPNVWLGVSVEDQATADARIPFLLETPAAVRWISAEPLLGPVDLTSITFSNERGGTEDWNALDAHGTKEGCTAVLDWVVVGGESGKGARPMHPDWARSLRDQCMKAGTSFLFKQWGQWAPCELHPPHTAPLAVVTSSGKLLQGPQSVFGHHEEADAEIIASFGKRLAGRVLDGALHDAYPEA